MHTIRRLTVAVAFIGVVVALRSATEARFDTLTAGSQVYTNVTVTGQTPTVLYIRHAKGVGSIKLKDLDPVLQKQFGFDPVKAAEVEKLQQESNADYVKALAAKQAAKAEPAAGAPSPSGDAAAPKPGPNGQSFLNQRGPAIVFEKWMGEAPNVEGKFVLLDFWATWCGPCRQSIPHLNELSLKYGDRMAVIGLSDESAEDVRKMTDPLIEYYSAVDTKQRTSSFVGVRAIPHALLMDPQGIVRFEGHPGSLSEDLVVKILTQYAN